MQIKTKFKRNNLVYTDEENLNLMNNILKKSNKGRLAFSDLKIYYQ